MVRLLDEDIVRLIAFAGVFLIMAIAERLMPRRSLQAEQPRRWLANLGLTTINTIVARLIVPMGAIGVAMTLQQLEWGLFNQVQIPTWLAVVSAFVLLDFAIYLQHVLFHALPFLWRLHRVHHADLDIDVTTGLRFHTLEIVISLAIKLAVVCLLGAPPLAVVIFEITLNATSMFNHANLKLPGWLDFVLRLVVVTPDMHRVHHSANPLETNRNFGFNLPWWDFLLGTYLAQPAKGHEAMTIGLADLRDEQAAERLPAMLALPFLHKSEPEA